MTLLKDLNFLIYKPCRGTASVPQSAPKLIKFRFSVIFPAGARLGEFPAPEKAGKIVNLNKGDR